MKQTEPFKPRSNVGDGTDPNTSTELCALDWGISLSRHRFIDHNGVIVGFHRNWLFFSEKKWGIVILTNEDLYDSAAMQLFDPHH